MNQVPQKRQLIWWAVLIAYFGSLYLASGTPWGPRLLALLPLLFAWPSLRHFAGQFPAIRRRLFRRVVRFIHRWRIYSTCSATPGALYHLSVVFLCVTAAFVLFGMSVAAKIALACCVTVIAIASCMDLWAKLSRVLRAAWAPAAGKLLSLSSGVALAASALSLAKESAHTLARIDPKFLPEFTTILAIGMLPIVYGAALLAILAIYNVLQLAVLGSFFLLSVPMEFVTSCVSSSYRMKMQVIWYRLRTGKQPPGRTLPESQRIDNDELPYFARPIGTLVLVLLLSSLLQSVIAVMPGLRPTLAKTLVWLEYRSASACTNLPRETLVAYMEDGLVSVAVPDSGSFRFEVVRCELGKIPLEPGT